MNIQNNKPNIQSIAPNFNGVNLSQIPKVAVDNNSSKDDGKIYGQDTCWKLYKPKVLEDFIKSDEELAETLSDTLDLARLYGLEITIDMLQKLKSKKPEIDKFYETVKSKYDIDLNIPPKVYRFIGQSEIDALRKDGIVKPERGYWEKFDVTINPNLNWNKYRVTFKPKEEFSVSGGRNSRIKENPGTDHDYFYHYEGPYTMDDIEIIEQYRP